MASDLVNQLKDRLDLEKLVREHGIELKRSGKSFKGLCPFHDDGRNPSFHVYPKINAFKCHGCKRTGDVLTWLAWTHCKTATPDADQFVEVLQEGCKIAGLNDESYRDKDPRYVERAKRERHTESVLALYAETAERTWTRETLAEAQRIKPWLTQDIIERWHLGFAPNLEQLENAGLLAPALRAVGLLLGDKGNEYLHFRGSIIIPFFKSARVVFLADRTLGDRSRKTLSMPAPDDHGLGGVSMPDGFNLDALHGVWPGNEEGERGGDESCLMVEGPLDAIACCERGHAAVAMITSTPSPGLVARVRRNNSKVVLALDGTADVTQAKRCREAAKFGPLALVALLSNGMDPDDLEAEYLASIKSEARPALTEWLELIDGDPSPDLRAELGRILADWEQMDPAGSGARKGAVCDRMGLTPANYAAWLAKEKPKVRNSSTSTSSAGPASKWKMDPLYPNQPAPPCPPESGDDSKRNAVTNYAFKVENDGEGNETKKIFRRSIDDVRDQVNGALNGFPFRWGNAGEKHPILFVPDGIGSIRPITGPSALASVAHEYSDVKFKDSKADSAGNNFIGWDLLFQHFGGSMRVPQYKGISYRPHEPAIGGQFYTWIPPEQYTPEQADGRWIAQAVKLFSNIAEPWQRYIYAAALCTPFWGGPLGSRPCFVFGADKEGSGKSYASDIMGAAAGGFIEIQAGKKAEEQLFERVLSADGAYKILLRIDNLKGALSSSQFEAMITMTEISGKKMYQGESSRPNTLTLVVTMNSVKVSPDMARRSFFMHFKTPKISGQWDRDYRELSGHGAELVSDAMSILRAPRPAGDLEGIQETFAPWAYDVLARVAAHPLIIAAAGERLDVRKILGANQAWRESANEALERASMFEAALIRYIAAVRHYVRADRSLEDCPTKDVRISADELHACWLRTFGGKSTKAWTGRLVNQDLKAGRFNHLRAGAHSQSGSTYEIAADAFRAYLEQVQKGEAEVEHVGTHDEPPKTQGPDDVPEAFLQ